MKTIREKTKDIQELSVGEHSLEEVFKKAGFCQESKDICQDCGRKLPEAKVEVRDGGYFEFVTYCPCGAIYTD